MATYNQAGADAAGAYDEQFRQLIANDPDIQRVIQGVWGTGARPSDTPKHLEKANHAASEQIGQILASKGINLPDRTFVNPRTGSLEGHRGWSGLSGLQKALAIAAAAGVGGVGALAATGALTGGAGAAGAGIGATTGVPAGLGSVGATGIGAGSLAGGLGATAGLPAGMAGVGATGIGAGGLTGGNMGWGSVIANLGKAAAKQYGGDYINQLTSGKTLSAAGQGLGAISGTQAHNRGAALEAMLASDEMKLAADRERRAAESDIMKKMQIASYLQGGGFQESGPATSVSGKPLGKFDFGVRPATESEMQMATELSGQLKDRLRNPIQLQDYNSKIEPGKMESTLNWLGPILSIAGAARTPSYFPQATAAKATQTPETATTPIDWATFSPAKPRQAGNPWDNVRF